MNSCQRVKNERDTLSFHFLTGEEKTTLAIAKFNNWKTNYYNGEETRNVYQFLSFNAFFEPV